MKIRSFILGELIILLKKLKKKKKHTYKHTHTSRDIDGVKQREKEVDRWRA